MNTALLPLALLCLAAAEKPAEQALRAKPKPIPAKGAIIEAIIGDLDDGNGDEAINLDGAQQFDLPDMDGWSHQQRQDWIVANKIDLLADYARNRWALATVNLMLKAIPAIKWDTVASAELDRVLSRATPSAQDDIEVLERGGVCYHLLTRGATAPVTFAFKTSEGNLGVLQVVEFREKPRGIKIRYKLEPPTQASRPETGSTRGTFLFVRTEPAGAEVLVDGRLVGASDDLFRIEPGVRTVIINLDGHDPEDEVVTIRAGRVTRLELKLTKEADSPVDPARTIQIPKADTPNADVVLDLASGQTMTPPDGDQTDFARLGKGDLFYMAGFLGCLRGAKPMLWDGERFVAMAAINDDRPPTRTRDVVADAPSQTPPIGKGGKKIVYQSVEVEMKPAATGYKLPKIPCRLLITTAESKHFDLTILSMSDEAGMKLEYRPANSSVVPKELLDEAAVREVISRYVHAIRQRDMRTLATCLANKKYLDADELGRLRNAMSAGLKMDEIREVHVGGSLAIVATPFVDIPDLGHGEPVSVVYNLTKQKTGWMIRDIDVENREGLKKELGYLRNTVPPNRNIANGETSAVKGARATFGPVVQRVFAPAIPRMGTFVDLESGKTFQVPEEVKKDSSGKKLIAWAKENKVDINVRVMPGPICYLGSLDSYFWRGDETNWQKTTADDVLTDRQLQEGELGYGNITKRPDELPAVYMFKTRECNGGLLEIVEFDESAADAVGVSIRFKLLRIP